MTPPAPLQDMVPARFQGLERYSDGVVSVFVAEGFRSRLLGLALLRDVPHSHALLIPRCSSVHTFGMRFDLDVTFLDAEGRTLHTTWDVRPGRVVRHRGAAAVLERRSFASARAPDRGGGEARPGRPVP